MQCLSDEKEIINKSFSDKDLQKLCNILKEIASKNGGKLNVKITYTDGYSFEGDNKYMFKNQTFKRKKVDEIRYKLTTPKGSLYLKLRLKSCKRSFYVIKNMDKVEFNNQRKIVEDYLDIIAESSILQVITKSYISLFVSFVIICILFLIINIYILKLKMIISIISSIVITSLCCIFIFIYYQSVTLKRYNRNPARKAILYVAGIVLTELISIYIGSGLGGLLNG